MPDLGPDKSLVKWAVSLDIAVPIGIQPLSPMSGVLLRCKGEILGSLHTDSHNCSSMAGSRTVALPATGRAIIYCYISHVINFLKGSIVGALITSILSHHSLPPRATPIVAGCYWCSILQVIASDLQHPIINLWTKLKNSTILDIYSIVFCLYVRCVKPAILTPVYWLFFAQKDFQLLFWPYML